jgi:hypothetical protein
MSIIILIATLMTIATIVALVIIAKGTPAPTVASMLRRDDLKQGNRR